MKHKFRYIFLFSILLCLTLAGCDGGDEPHEHTAVSWQTVEAPTCAKEGRAVGKCSVCRTDMETTLPPLSHTLTHTVVQPTCATEGYTRYTCDCGYTYDGDYVSPLGHTLTETVTSATCATEGYTRYTCDCGYTYESDYVSPLGHTLVEAVTPATCTAEGYTRYTCDCGYTYDGDYVSPLGHTLTETVTPATCTTEGYTRYTCDCGYTYDGDYVSPLGHTLTETVTPATCTDEGYTRYTCDCGYTYDSDYVSPTGHDLTETVILPTCTEGGYTHFVCTVCGYEHDGNPTQPLSHRNTVATIYYPTFARDGFTRHTCSDCGQSYDDTVVRYADIVTGAYTDNTEILMQGIDVSKWNHEYGASLEDIRPLDWVALKAAGVDFVILKAGSTNGIDPSFEMNYRDAKAAGLQVGAYFYAYSATVEGTLADADMLLSWLEGKQFELPIYFDLEEIPLMELGGELLTEICKAFIGRVQEAGYYGALYTNTEWLYNVLDTEWIMENLDVWYARYTTPVPEGQEGFALTDEGIEWKDGTAYKPGETDKRYGIWQYTDSGVIEGFRYKFDFSYAFKDYAPLMVQWGLNGFSADAPDAEAL